MVKIITIGDVRVWFYVQQLLSYDGDSKNIIEISKYMCYFKFSEPTAIILGDLLRDENKKPFLFNSIEEAIGQGTSYVKKVWSL